MLMVWQRQLYWCSDLPLPDLAALNAKVEGSPAIDMCFDLKLPPSGCVSSHSARAVMLGSMPAFFHQTASSPQRCTSRWCPRQRGTTNSSLTLRPSADDWANRQVVRSAGRRPQTRQGSLATALRCSRSRMGVVQARPIRFCRRQSLDLAFWIDQNAAMWVGVHAMQEGPPGRLCVLEWYRALLEKPVQCTQHQLRWFFATNPRCAQRAASSLELSPSISRSNSVLKLPHRLAESSDLTGLYESRGCLRAMD